MKAGFEAAYMHVIHIEHGRRFGTVADKTKGVL